MTHIIPDLQEVAQNDSKSSGRHKVLDPCLPQGYDGLLNGVAVSGGGYFSRCREASSEIIAGDCASQHCGVRGLHVPPLAGLSNSCYLSAVFVNLWASIMTAAKYLDCRHGGF